MECIHKTFDQSATQEELQQYIQQLNKDCKINGIVLQLPLYQHINRDKLIYSIDPKKDVDGIHPYNIARSSSTLTQTHICHAHQWHASTY